MFLEVIIQFCKLAQRNSGIFLLILHCILPLRRFSAIFEQIHTEVNTNVYFVDILSGREAIETKRVQTLARISGRRCGEWRNHLKLRFQGRRSVMPRHPSMR